MATFFQVQPEQLPFPQRIWTGVALEVTSPLTPSMVSLVIGTPVVGLPVGEPFS